MQTSRVIEGTTFVGTTEQLDLVEEYEILLKGEKVSFATERGKRTGKVIGRYLSGGGSLPWTLWVTIAYRGGEYPIKANDVELVTR
jgi:hypothetical protein